MIELYYTNADSPLGAQLEPRKSLGGNISSTRIPNDELNNLFGDISLAGMQDFKRATKAIAIKNVTGADLTNLSVYLVAPALPYAEFELAFAAVADNGDGPFMERIDNQRASPYTAQWDQPTQSDPLVLADTIADQEYVGLWVRRQIIDPGIDVRIGTIADLSPGESLEVNGQQYTKEQLQKETFDLTFEWP